MGQLILPKHHDAAFRNPRVAPPEDLVEIDWSHPDAEGLLFYSIGLRDLVSGAVAVPWSGYGAAAAGRNHGPMGFELESHDSSNATGSFVWKNCTAFEKLPGQPFGTIITSVSIDNASSNARITGLPSDSTSRDAPDSVWSIGQSGDITAALLRWTGEFGSLSHVQAITSTGFITKDSKPHMYGWSKNDTTTMKVFKDGAFFEDLAHVDHDNDFDTVSTLNNVYAFSINESSSWSLDGRMQIQAYWLRDLPAGEHARFYANPYALLRPRVPTLYYFQSGPVEPLDNDRISAIHFMRPWEPTAMGE